MISCTKMNMGKIQFRQVNGNSHLNILPHSHWRQHSESKILKMRLKVPLELEMMHVRNEQSGPLEWAPTESAKWCFHIHHDACLPNRLSKSSESTAQKTQERWSVPAFWMHRWRSPAHCSSDSTIAVRMAPVVACCSPGSLIWCSRAQAIKRGHLLCRY